MNYRVKIEPVSPGASVSESSFRYQDARGLILPEGLREFVVKQANRSNNVSVIVKLIQEAIMLYNADQDVSSIVTALNAIWDATNSLTISAISPSAKSHLTGGSATITGTGFDLFTGLSVTINGVVCSVASIDSATSAVIVVPATAAGGPYDVVVSYLFDTVNTAKTLATAFTWT